MFQTLLKAVHNIEEFDDVVDIGVGFLLEYGAVVVDVDVGFPLNRSFYSSVNWYASMFTLTPEGGGSIAANDAQSNPRPQGIGDLAADPGI